MLGTAESHTAITDWPAEYDAVAAAPHHHRVLLENDRVRVLETEIAPGARTPDHTHRWGGVLYIASWSDFIRRDADGNVTFDSRMGSAPAVGSVVWIEPTALHSVENVGTTLLRVIACEIK